MISLPAIFDRLMKNTATGRGCSHQTQLMSS